MTGTRRTGTVGWFRRFAVTAAVSIVAMIALAGPASAHNVLVSSSPANGATVQTAPKTVSLTFDQPIENFDPALKVLGPNGNDFTTSAPLIQGATISATMSAGPAGPYRVVYRIVSADGHPVTGQITFVLSDSAAGSAVGIPTEQPSAPADQASSGGALSGLGVWIWVVAIVAALIIIAAIVIAARRPRR